jgi:transcriptional regulator with XRE-family HTH domain
MCTRLREAREHAGLTQAQAASALAQPQNFISKCENGERRIDAIELANFIELYQTTLDTLIPALGGARFRKVAEPVVAPKKKGKQKP